MFMNNMQEYLPALLTGDIDYANCISLEWYPSHPLTCVLGVSVYHQRVCLQFWRFGEMWSTSSFPLVPGPLWPKVVVDVSVAG